MQWKLCIPLSEGNTTKIWNTDYFLVLKDCSFYSPGPCQSSTSEENGRWPHLANFTPLQRRVAFKTRVKGLAKEHMHNPWTQTHTSSVVMARGQGGLNWVEVGKGGGWEDGDFCNSVKDKNKVKKKKEKKRSHNKKTDSEPDDNIIVPEYSHTSSLKLVSPIHLPVH